MAAVPGRLFQRNRAGVRDGGGARRLAVAGRNGLSAVHFAGVGFGIVVSALVVHGLKGPGHWAGQWIVFGALTALAAALCGVALGERKARVPATGFEGGGLALDARFIALLAAYGVFGFGYVITTTFLVAIVRGAGQPASHETLVWLVVGLAVMPSVWLWGRVAARIGVFAAFALACAVESVGVVASVASDHPAAIYLAAACLGGTFMGITAMGLVAARALPAPAGALRDPRRSVALMTASFGLGQMAGPAVAGALYAATGTFMAASMIAAGLLGLAAAVVIWIMADLRRGAPARG